MKVVVGLVVGCLVAFSIQAQEVSFSALQKKKATNSEVSIIAEDDKSIYTAEVLSKEQQVVISSYSSAGLQTQWSKTVPYNSIADNRFETIVKHKDGFFLFTSTFHKESEQLRIDCSMLDNNANLLGDPVLVHYVLSEGRELSPQFGVEVSADGNKFLIYFDPPFERKNTEPLSFRCYDIELDILWEKEILLPYSNHTIQVHQFGLDNAANLYMLSGRKNINAFTKLSKPETGKHILFYYNPKENKLKEYDVTLKDKQIASVQMSFDAKSNIIIAGFYSSDYKMNINGTFFYNFGIAGGGVLAASFMPFKGPVLERYKTSETQDYLPDYYLKNIIPLSDGNTLLVGEQQYLTEEVLQDQMINTSRVETRHHFGNILVSKLEANGRHVWNAVVPKEQYSIDNDFSSYSYSSYLNNDGIQFLYNDQKENPEKFPATQKLSPWTGSGNSSTTISSIDKDGNVQLKSLFSNKEKQGLLNISSNKQPSRSFIISSSSSYSLGRIK